MDLIDRAELKKEQMFGSVRLVDIDNAQKVDAVPMSVIEEIKADATEEMQIMTDVMGNDYYSIKMSDLRKIIDEKVKEYMDAK